MEIRQATSDDREDLLSLWEQLDAHHRALASTPKGHRLWSLGPQRAVQVTKRLDELLEKDLAAIFVAEEDGELIGYIGGEVLVRPEGARPRIAGQILTAFVREDRRSRGIGTALVDAILSFFESNEVEEVTLRYVIANRLGERFWQRLGFEPVICTANTRPDELRHKLNQLGR